MTETAEVETTEVVPQTGEEAEINPYTMSDEEVTTALEERLNPKPEVTEEAAATEAIPPAKEDAPVKTDEPPEKAPVPTLETLTAELASFKDTLDKADKRNRDKDAFITKLQQENQTLRQNLRPSTQTPEQAWEKLAANPDTYIDQRLRETTLTQVREAQEREQAVRGKVENFDDLKDDIAALALEDGFPEEAVRAFKYDPWTTSDPEVILNYAKRAQERRKVVLFEQKVAHLQSEIERLKKQPEKVIRKIEEATRQAKGLTAGTGSPGTSKGMEDLTDEQIFNMPSDQVAALLKERLQREYGG